MKHDPDKHHRRSIRLPGYDYSSEGMYFVTLCTHDRGWLFGQIVDGEMFLNAYGLVIHEEWSRTTQVRSQVILDAFVIMPNHFHGIIIIRDDGNVGETGPVTLPQNNTSQQRPKGLPSGSIGAIIAQFKRESAVRINRLRGTSGAHVWQRNYYEHIIRDEQRLHEIRDYIHRNPEIWTQDKLYTEV